MGEPTSAARRPPVLLGAALLLILGRPGAEALGPDAYGTLYQLGKEAYLEEDYRSCVSLLLQALHEQREFEQLLLDCRGRCRREAAAETLLLGAEEADGLATFERLIRETRCLVQCHRSQLGEHLQKYYDSAWADDEFRDRKPYEYLQLCYYKTGEVQKAANAVFTVLLQQPNNEIMRENFKYYTTMEGVDNANIVSLERQEHTELYLRGNDAYEAGRWSEVTRLMEDALEGFLEAEERCRTLCERFFPQGFNPDFVANVANHFAYVLRCKIRCNERLSTVAGNQLADFLESHFHYLQFAYFKQGMFQEACSNVANYLLFKPEDKDMLNNKRLYLKEDGVGEDLFTPRSDILALFKRRKREQKLDNYIIESFRFSGDETRKKGDGILQSSGSKVTPPPPEKKTTRNFTPNGIRPEVPGNDQAELGPGESSPETGQRNTGTSPTDTRTDQTAEADQGGRRAGGNGPRAGQAGGPSRESGALLALHGRVMAAVSPPPAGPWLQRATITSGPAELGGPQRFVADHLLTRPECQRLTALLQAVGVVGDGYRSKDPLSKHEELRGLSLGRLITRIDRGDASRDDLRFLLDISDSARLLVAQHFDVTELYSSFTHLVSRTHVPALDANRSRSDLSHTVHVDNCQLLKNGTCSRGRGAYIHRHFSAILYLNDNFTGGEFVFADIVNRNLTGRVRPRCGRLVGFSAGQENPHGVLAVTRGSRHALAMWYTRTQRQQEEERMVADLYLHDSSAPVVRRIVSILEKNYDLADKAKK